MILLPKNKLPRKTSEKEGLTGWRSDERKEFARGGYATSTTYSGGWLLTLVDVAEAVVEDDFVDEVVDVERESEVRVSESIFIKV